MMNAKLLRSIVVQQRKELLEKSAGMGREMLEKAEKYLSLPHAIVITGVRRCGKSVFLRQLMRRHFEGGFYYLNFDDERFASFDAKEDFDRLYGIFLEFYGEQKIFFFDEIQNVPGWERFVGRMQEKGFKFIITGSNARLLSRELATHLTGRHVSVGMYPFSFAEFLKFAGVGPAKDFEHLPEESSKLRKRLSEYVEEGGFPEYLKFREKDILRMLYNDIVFRDIIVRYKIRETRAFLEIADYLLSNIGSPVTYNRIKSLFGLGSPNTAKNFVEYLESSFLMFFVSQFSYSKSAQAASPKKVYCVDTGLRNAVAYRISDDWGKLAENVVFVELKRRGGEVYYWKGPSGGEVDFVVKKGLKVEGLIQVCWDVENHETKRRETSSLLAAMKGFRLKSGLVITGDFEGDEAVGGKKIVYVPLWKWLLGK